MGVVAVVGGEVYDEAAIKAGLDAIETGSRVLFASACAERLYALYGWLVARAGQGTESELREALDLAWSVESGNGVARSELDRRRAAVEALVPHDDDADWSVWSPLAQNSAASVAYALRTWLSGHSQDAVWAARQAYEVADYLVQLKSPGETYAPEGEPVALVVRWIADALRDCGSVGAERLRAAAVADGATLLQVAQELPGG